MDDDDFDSSDTASSENETETRVRKLMDRIFKKRGNIKSEQDINQMVAECSDMLDGMNCKSKPGKASKSNQLNRQGASGDHKNPTKQLPKKQNNGNEQSSKDPSKYLESLMKSPSVKELMEEKKGKPNFSQMYKERLTQMMTKAPPSSVKNLLGKAKDGNWRKKIEALMEDDSSESLGSSRNSGKTWEDSELDSEELRLENAILAGNSEVDKKDKSHSFLSKEEYNKAKKKAQEWMRSQKPRLVADGMKNMDLEEMSSEESNDSDIPMTRNALQKKTDSDLKALKAKLEAYDMPSTSATLRNTCRPSSSTLHPKKLATSPPKKSSLPSKHSFSSARKTGKKS